MSITTQMAVLNAIIAHESWPPEDAVRERILTDLTLLWAHASRTRAGDPIGLARLSRVSCQNARRGCDRVAGAREWDQQQQFACRAWWTGRRGCGCSAEGMCLQADLEKGAEEGGAAHR
jgi:hypothetical protein